MGKIVRGREEYGGSSSAASLVNYDNSNSGLESNNLQSAVDELNIKVKISTEELTAKIESFENTVNEIGNLLADI